MFYVYTHSRPPPDYGVFYIGKGCRRRAWSSGSRNQHWRSIVKKHGRPVVTIIAGFETEAEAFALEVELIALAHEMGARICNKTFGGEGASGIIHSPGSRAANSARARLQWEKKSPAEQLEVAERLSRSKPSWEGRRHSEEAKKKISAANSGRKVSPEVRAAIAATTRGRRHSPESRALMSARLIEANRQPEVRERRARAARERWAKVDPSQRSAHLEPARRAKKAPAQERPVDSTADEIHPVPTPRAP